MAVLAIVFFTTFVQQAEYKIPIQYTKLVQGAPTSSYLPFKKLIRPRHSRYLLLARLQQFQVRLFR